jgi:hypothetical protein
MDIDERGNYVLQPTKHPVLQYFPTQAILPSLLSPPTVSAHSQSSSKTYDYSHKISKCVWRIFERHCGTVKFILGPTGGQVIAGGNGQIVW